MLREYGAPNDTTDTYWLIDDFAAARVMSSPTPISRPPAHASYMIASTVPTVHSLEELEELDAPLVVRELWHWQRRVTSP